MKRKTVASISLGQVRTTRPPLTSENMQHLRTPKARVLSQQLRFFGAAVPSLQGTVNETVILSVPDFNSQNIMVDWEGNLIGTID